MIADGLLCHASLRGPPARPPALRRHHPGQTDQREPASSTGGGQVVASVRVLAFGACVFALLAVAAAFALRATGAHRGRPPPLRAVAERQPPPPPSLHCLFSDFTHASVVVGYDFAVASPANGPPKFAERAEAVRDDPATTFDAGSRPDWSYAIDEDGTKTITSPDGATHILLYGLKLGIGDAEWIEAGIRSNMFRNLDGKCLQSHFDELGHQTNTTAAHP